MIVMFVIKKYQSIKAMTPAERKDVVPRVWFLGGTSRPGQKLFLQLIKFIMNVAKVLDEDKDTKDLIKLVFLVNFNNTKEYLYIPSLDVNEQLTLPGQQACATQVMKYVMNGSILIGSKDATNLRIEKCLGQNIVLMFGQDYFEIKK